ncbi:MAG: hypothetical protein WC872_02800 [Candidatus Absconditabacterales bacterium]
MKKKLLEISLLEQEKPKQEKKGFYNKYDLVSYLIKSIRIGDKHKSIAILHTMLNQGIPEIYISRKLVHFASEDSIGSEFFIYAKNVHDWIRDSGSEVNSLSRLILTLCESPKFWESESESYWEGARIFIREFIKDCFSKKIKPFELPEWVFDIYTATGKMKSNKGEKIDCRYSGVLQGGLYMRAEQKSLGKLDPKKHNKECAYNQHLLNCMQENLSIDEYIKKYNVRIDDFFISVNKNNEVND